MNDATATPAEFNLDFGSADAGNGYRVLARKYRPATFDDLIGQDAMVRTLANSFAAGRIPQAWILTGVRGVGKTTTARILARGLNYAVPGEADAPTVQMPKLGVHCQAIIDSRHIDVIEMDAASHNGVDDVRQINDAVRYAPVSARYKVYILDEVHMLSTAAFNALLKTLEEPPPHVKFVFATTEIRKVPVTILSRCQRFDLRRVDSSLLVAHLASICAKEGVQADQEALALIARAAEGSVRDSLSLLDQAIAHADGAVQAEQVRTMLGLADRARLVDLFGHLMHGDMHAALTELRDQYDAGADPVSVLNDLADYTNFVTRVKVVPAVAEDAAFAEVERTRAREFATTLSMRVLSRTWQMLLKSIAETAEAPKPIAAAEMALIRIAHAADLPSPEDAIRMLNGDATTTNGPAPKPAHSSPPSPPQARSTGTRAGQAASAAAVARQPYVADAAPRAIETAAPTAISDFNQLIALAAEKRDLMMKAALERDVRLVSLEDGRLEIALEPGASKALVQELSRKLSTWTGRPWMVAISSEAGAPTLRAQTQAQQQALTQGVGADPAVQAVLARFPGAEIVGVRPRETAPLPLPDEFIASDEADID
jgi:DNA polymerase III subunit gamma/tau